MTEEQYLLQADKINETYKKQIEGLASQYIKEKEHKEKGYQFEFAGIHWEIEHARIKVRVFDVPTIIYQCVMLDDKGKKTSTKREFLEEQIENDK